MSTAPYTEQDFEDHVCEHLAASGYEVLPRDGYDKSLCLIPAEVAAFIRETQPKGWEALERQYGADTERNVLDRLAREIERWGTLHVLRNGIKDRGQKLRLAYFKPSSGLNPEHLTLYRKNRLAVIRQLRYSAQNEKSLDLALFLNGIPLATAELKNSLTGQFVEQAKKQYREDRDQREPLFRFKRCLVHFAVGNEEVWMTTRLQGHKTFFLPFNKGSEDGGAGNPVNPTGHATAYLWEDILQPDSLLDLLQNYLHVQEVTDRVYDPVEGKVVEKTYELLIFPRFHQLDAVRKLLAAAKAEGAGHSYLVQHSAGSGKSNSIAWLAHQLAKLYETGDAKDRLFDTIIVVTDRRVLDQQLQRTIKQFEQVQGVVLPVDAGAEQLKNALEKGKDIVITTLQKFPFISEAVAGLQGKRFAVIIDEAHSSQSGEYSKHLKQALNASLEDAEREDEDAEPDIEDRIVTEIRTRGRQPHISYFAFTATPKGKTLELFGRKNADGKFVASHVYSMRQAIEERFILDVLTNYTTFKRYFKLVKSIEDDEEYERPKAARALTSWVDLQDHAIETKARIVLDHFLSVTANAIRGRGRAMFVTRSRLHAVRFFQKLHTIMRDERGLPFKPLVAFSGKVKDPDTGAEYYENTLNGLPYRVSIPDAFKYPEYRILVVANKFQTGFDEPLLHTMYVDKKLGGVQAVQTLSRLNRTAWSEGKVDPIVLDFVNEVEDIQTAFQDYYQTTFLDEETDPNKLYTLHTELEVFEVFTDEDVDEYASVFFDESKPDELLQPVLDRTVRTWRHLPSDDDREEFRSTLQTFVRLYGYIAQLVSFEDVDLEKLYVFARSLNRKLPKRTGRGLPVEVVDAVDLHSFRIRQTFEGDIRLEQTSGTATPIPTTPPSAVHHPDMDFLSNIVTTLNETFGLDLTDEHRVLVERIVQAVEADEEVQAVMDGNNSVSNKRHKVDRAIDDRIFGHVNTSIDLFRKLTDPTVNESFKRHLFNRLLARARSA